jgi:hypothetical protein
VVTVLVTRNLGRQSSGASASVPAAATTPPAPMSAATATAQVMRIRAETIRLTLRVDPEESRVSLDGKTVTTMPIVLPRSVSNHTVRVEADGYITQDLKVSAVSNQTLVIQLRPRPRVTTPRRRRRRRVVRPTMRPVGMKQIRAITDI